MKKGLKLKLGMSVASLALLAGALSTTTYAWFTTNAEAKTSNIEVNAEATSDSIYLSLDGVHFSNSVAITASDVKLTAVSYKGDAYKKYNGQDAGTDSDWDSTTAGVVNSENGVTGTASAGQYLTFTLYFKTTSSGSNIVFDTDNTTFTNGENKPFTLLADYNESTAGTTYSNGYLVNATRLAVTSYSTGFEGAAKTENSNFGTGTREVYYTVDGTKTSYDTDKGTIKTDDTNYAWEYYQSVMGAKTNVKPTEEVAKAIESTTVVAANAKAGFIYKADFTFYVEGFDAECMDAVLGQAITMGLGFKLGQ